MNSPRNVIIVLVVFAVLFALCLGLGSNKKPGAPPPVPGWVTTLSGLLKPFMPTHNLHPSNPPILPPHSPLRMPAIFTERRFFCLEPTLRKGEVSRARVPADTLDAISNWSRVECTENKKMEVKHVRRFCRHVCRR